MYDLVENKTAFNNAVYATSRAVSGKVDVWKVGDEVNTIHITDIDDLQSIEIERGVQADEALIGGAISKRYTIKIIDRNYSKNFTGKRVKPYIGIEAGGTVIYVPFPEADVYESAYDSSNKVWSLTCYDDMQKLNSIYINKLTISEEALINGEISLRSYAQAVCALAGLALSSNPFFMETLKFSPNNWEAEEENKSYPNLSGNESLRDVISKIAEASLSNAVINRVGNVEFIPVSKSFDELNDSFITGNEYFSCKIDEKFGPINTVVLSRDIQSDNVYYPEVSQRGSVTMGDEPEADTVLEHISQFGLHEFTVKDNPFLDRVGNSDDSRYDYLEEIFEEVRGLSYYAYTLDWRGNPVLDEGDRIVIKKLDDTEIETTYFGDVITFNGALKASAKGKIVSQTATEYEKAATVQNALKRAELKVDKNEGTIESLVSLTSSINDALNNAVTNIETLSTNILQTAEEITNQIKKSGGSNLIRNSSGRGGTTSWDVTGSVNTGTDAANTISNSYFKINDGSITQAFTLAAGEYTLSFRYKSNNTNAYVNINNEETNIIQVAAEQAINWTKVETISLKYEIETTFTLKISSDRESFMIADIMLSEGNSEAWQQAPDEMYATGVTFDINGLHIEQTDAETEFIADSAGVRIVRSDNYSSEEDIIASFDKYGTNTKQIYSEGQIALGKTKIIPIDDAHAVMTVIHD